MVPMDCVNADFSDCCLLDICVIRDVWRDLKAATDDVLYSTSLADLLNTQMQREAEVEEGRNAAGIDEDVLRFEIAVHDPELMNA